MAEARQAVGFRFSVTPDGRFDINYDGEVHRIIWESAKRTWKKKWARLLNACKTGIFPIKFELFCGNILVLTTLNLSGFDFSYGMSDWIQGFINTFRIFSSFLSSIVISLFLVILVRLLLRILFSYQGWMFLPRNQIKNPPLSIKLWSLIIKSLCSLKKAGSGSNYDMLYSFQGSLPTQPLPSLRDTIKRYLSSVRPLMNDVDYESMLKLSLDFEKNLGSKLQWYLRLKWFWSDNYVSDWWEEYVYLRGRSPIMINSNYYMMDVLNNHPTKIQSARAANIVHSAFTFRRTLQKQEASPILLNNLVPLCSAQYDRLFNTSRIPKVGGDYLKHSLDSTHIVVMCKGKFYRMPCYVGGNLLDPIAMQKIIQEILDDDEFVKNPGEENIAVLTASDRDIWANARKSYFRRGINRNSLDIIDKASFILVLDDEEYHYDEYNENKLNHYGKSMLHGKANNRWFDKSFNVIISKNGRLGGNAEHSWADAPIIGHLWEHILISDIEELGYDDNGNCRGDLNLPVPKATKLQWELPAELQSTMNSCLKSALKLCDEIDLHILEFDDFGKGFMKKSNTSPDAFIQMALQLTYRTIIGHLSLTYEASMSRLFREGRTETVRSCTVESAAWVNSMVDDTSSLSRNEKLRLFKKACTRHELGYKEAMIGRGIDRHLFCLYVVSKYLNIESEFLIKVLREPWRLSTSQTAVRNKTNLISCGGGFGPVADDGYGVSYLIMGENKLFFHISSKKTCSKTDSKRFARTLEKSLQEIKKLNL